MPNVAQERYKPLLDNLLTGFSRQAHITRRTLRVYLEKSGFSNALGALHPDVRIDCAQVLSFCRPVMAYFHPEPSEGWMRRVYAHLANGLFADADFTPLAKGEKQAVEFFLIVFTWLLNQESAFCPPSPFHDIQFATKAELSHSRIRAEYAQFLCRLKESRYAEALRMARYVLPYDPAGHIIGVHNISVSIARRAAACGLPVDIPLLAAASLCHDVGKFGCRGEDAKRVPHLHYYYTWEWLTRGGMDEIAHVAANHSTWDLEFENLPIESLLLIYADFRVRGERDAAGNEQIHIYTLEEAREIILNKLCDINDEKRLQYETVYLKLRDFERFLRDKGVYVGLEDKGPLPPMSTDASLLSGAGAMDALRDMTFDHNIQLMHTLSRGESFEQLLEQARAEKNPQRIRTYLRLLEEYSIYLTLAAKLQALSFLYELLMHHEGDVRRHAGRIMGLILAGSGPRYRKELPTHAPQDAAAPGVTDVLLEATALWDTYIDLFLHPDVKISAKHALRISNSLKTVAGSLFAHCPPAEAPHYFAPLLSRVLKPGLPVGVQFVLVDALLHVPVALFSSAAIAALANVLANMLQSDELRLVISVLRLGERLLEADSDEAVACAQKLLQAAPGQPVVAYLVLRINRRLAHKHGVPAPGAQGSFPDISELYLSNLKNAVHWTVKLAYIDMLLEHAQTEGHGEAFHIAMHLSNLLSVSEHLPVRERAGAALSEIAPLLSVDQCNEIVIDLIRELESGQDEISRYIPPYLGALICRLPPKEMEECLALLEGLVRSSNIRPARTALSTLGAVLCSLCVEGNAGLERHILGLILTGIAHYEDSIHRTALHVLCRGFFANEAVGIARRRAVFDGCAKKLLTLLCEPRDQSLTFFNRAAMLNQLYRFITGSELTIPAAPLISQTPVAFFPGAFDPFSAGHRAIVDEIAALGMEVYLSIDEFSWSKRTLPKLLRRQIATMSVADTQAVFLFPDDIPINIANEADLAKLTELFPARDTYIVLGSDVIENASAYAKDGPGTASCYNHIVFSRLHPDGQAADAEVIQKRIHGKLIQLSLPAHYEGVSSSRIREYIDKNLDISMLVDPVVQDFIYSHALYLRAPLNKHMMTPEKLFLEAERQEGRYTVTLYRREDGAALGKVFAQALPMADAYHALCDRAAAEHLRNYTSGRLLMLNGLEEDAPGGIDAPLLLCNELLARSLNDDITYAFYRTSGPNDPLAPTLEQLGFIPLPEEASILYVDMRSASILVQDTLGRIKEPLRSDEAVVSAVLNTRPALRRALAALFPGKLTLCFDTELLNQALMQRVQQCNDVLDLPAGSRTLGNDMCVPYGKVLSGEIVPHTVTKTLHADKVFNPNLVGFDIMESPGYSSLVNQVRTLKSFRRPVLLVDDLLHNGYRLEKLDPIFKNENVPISRIIVGILSGRGNDLMQVQGRAVSCEYFIPNLHYWFTESLLYPFLGGDGAGGRTMEDTLQPSVNLILPYVYPRFMRNAPARAIWELSGTALRNAHAILTVLERRHQALFAGVLTIRRLSEALISPRIPNKGAHIEYESGVTASACLAEDMAWLDRLRPELK
ncbi:MAG: hypothetical protein LBN26_08685 [Christensenellaceae bacterium]|jgi:nicotinic acid mononucleotide adenylyltransferase|nr:hypothetical protein [Christensenellaceae bacterium]